jgi:hypothetical protein
MKTLVISACAVLTSGAVWAAAWTAVEQPNLAERIAKAPELKVEELVAPVRSARLGNNYLVPNPDSQSCDLLQVYFKQYGGPNTIVIMDLGTGKLRQVQTGRGYNFHLAPAVTAPDGKLYVSILGEKFRVQICVYDPATDEFKLNAIAMPEDILGETHPLIRGPDGLLYAGGAHPTKAASVVQIDPKTGVATAFGPIGPSHAPSDCWSYSLAADERYVYVASGKVPWYVVAYDKQTRQWETLLTTEKVDGYAGVGSRDGGCVARVSKLAGESGDQPREY